MIAEVAALILHLQGPVRDLQLAFRIGEIVSRESIRAGFDGRLVASIAFSESSFNERAEGARGEIGLMQVLPTGEASFLCKGLRIQRTRDNVRCALRILHRARTKCGPDPALYVSRYNGRACVSSRYSRRVLARLGP